MAHHQDVIDDLRSPTRALRRAAPEAWAGFAQLHDAALRDGALSSRTKELMALVEQFAAPPREALAVATGGSDRR